MLDIVKLDELYEKYGFKKHNTDNSVAVYTYSNGYFHNAEVVIIDSNYDSSGIVKEFQEIGYACKLINYSDIDETHRQLFNGFFSVSSTKERLRSDYNRFSENQSRTIRYTYNYINCMYTYDGKEEEESIIQKINSIIHSNGPRLIILEAAAGYGKTCTSYELLKEIIENHDSETVPIFTELSRNRKATVFKYILLDEIDRLFHYLKSDLVVNEIQEGRIPLIVDGFDELITKSSEIEKKTGRTSDAESFDDVESMLDTIGDLLIGEAKIVLTSRKSAIFTGDKFDNWLNNRSNEFKVTRLVLGEPSIKDWLGTEKLEILKQKNVPYSNLANPVLLAFLKNISIIEFESYCNNIEMVISKYFTTLLEREKDRQNILFTVDEQIDIFMGLAQDMVDLDISSEDRDFIKEAILEKHKDLINEVRSRYPYSSRPDTENIASTLAGHALLDRTGAGIDSNKIGFVNDFVFGILIGDSICATDKEWIIDYKYIDLACTAYSIRTQEKKDLLFSRLNFIQQMLNSQEKIEVDIRLRNELTGNHYQAVFYSLNFRNFNFTDEYTFNECTFNQCTFNKVRIRKSVFSKCIFIDCRFYDCEIVVDLKDDRELVFSNCLGDDISLLRDNDNEESEVDSSYERVVLEQFWPRGRANAQPTRAYRTLFSGIQSRQYGEIDKAINTLRRKGLIEKEGELVYLRYEHMSEIRKILCIEEGDK